ncbi:hypothetical protein DL93DRAFT_2097869 [Clavulina sp. PMI_390]|nr:hypothetical protein DL93DRAFT_2097869 [Clavulina sp. PMI_390]
MKIVLASSTFGISPAVLVRHIKNDVEPRLQSDLPILRRSVYRPSLVSPRPEGFQDAATGNAPLAVHELRGDLKMSSVLFDGRSPLEVVGVELTDDRLEGLEGTNVKSGPGVLRPYRQYIGSTSIIDGSEIFAANTEILLGLERSIPFQSKRSPKPILPEKVELKTAASWGIESDMEGGTSRYSQNIRRRSPLTGALRYRWENICKNISHRIPVEVCRSSFVPKIPFSSFEVSRALKSLRDNNNR